MSQFVLFEHTKSKLVNLKEASIWATYYLKRKVTISNISYLIQYGRIKKHGTNGRSLIDIGELRKYYDAIIKANNWKQALGDDVNWHLSFVEYKESERTKHVHRIHPYKGKFIPQLVEYFLDSHRDEFKKGVYFNKGDIILDPFCGSGTTLVQANELGIHAIGIDISSFNTMISNIKITRHDFSLLKKAIRSLTLKLDEFQKDKNNVIFENELLNKLAVFNSKYFPSPEYKRKVRNKEINEKEYALKREKEFLNIYYKVVDKYKINIVQDRNDTFLDKWFLLPVRAEIDFLFAEIKKNNNSGLKKVLAVILSRTVRSCRATTHADLATLRKPVTTTYYCKKHGKICKPIFSIMGWWKRYGEDTLRRLQEFDNLRSDTHQICLTGDSRTINLIEELQKSNVSLAEILRKRRIKGIFSSPPYVGLINYHEQHAYAYEIFGLERKDELEIGPLFKGQGKEARKSYIQNIVEVLLNCKKYLQNDYDIFIVANDKYNLYPEIANLAGMKIVKQFKRPVLNRVEKDRSAYAEIIFHLKEKE